MKRMATGLLTAAAFLAAVPAAARAADGAEAWATVEIAEASQRRGPAALLDDTWIADLVERASWGDFLADAAKAAALAEAPEFKGMTTTQIGWAPGVTVKLERREAPGIVVVHTTGGDAARCTSMANAVARWLVVEAKAEAKRRAEERRTQFEDAIATADAQIRLLHVDKVGAMQGAGLADATFELEFERLTEYRRARGAETDELARGLLLDQATHDELAAALEAGPKGTESLKGHILVLRDDRVRDLTEDVEAAKAEREDLAARGVGKDHPDALLARLKVERAESAVARAINRIAQTFVRDVEDRRARLNRAAADLDDNAKRLAIAHAVRRIVEEKDTQIERALGQKQEAVAALEELTSSAGPDAIRLLTQAWPPPAGK